LNWISYPLRNYDPQLGRWHSVDPRNQFASPYVGLGNNPINGIDPTGGWFWEKRHIRQARKLARQTGGTFEKWKGEDGKRYASVDFAEGNTALSFVFRPGQDRSGLLFKAGVDAGEVRSTQVSGMSYVSQMLTMGDRWMRDTGGEPAGRFIADLNPIWAAANSANQLIYGQNLYGENASTLDKALGTTDLVPQVKVGAKLGVTLFKGLKEFKNLAHSVANIRKSATYQNLRKLTDDELLETVDPQHMKKYGFDEGILETLETGSISRGNNRLYELQRRMGDPKSSITPDTKIPFEQRSRGDSDYFYDLE